MSVITDDNTTFMNSSIQTKVDAEITISLFLIPASNTPIEIVKVYSSKPEVLLIESVDANERVIKARAISSGQATISIMTSSHGNSSTLPIHVKAQI